MLFSSLPSRPHHCFCTPGVLSPFLGSLVSSTMPMEGAPGCSVRTSSCTRSRIRSSSHLNWLKNSCKVRGATLASQVGTRILAGKTIGEPLEIAFEFRFQLTNLFGIHARSSLKPNGKDIFADSTEPSKVNTAL